MGYYLALVLSIGCCFAQNNTPPTPISVTRSEHLRLPLPSPLQRMAIGDSQVLSAEPLNNRELLLLGKSSGRTSLLVWFNNGTVHEYLVTVRRDLSLLQSALKRIYPTIEAEIAPDRDAIVLTGAVPDITYRNAAESAANNYLSASATNAGRVLIQERPAAGGPAAPGGQQPGQPGAAGQPAQAQPAGPPTPPEAIRAPAILQASGTVINLITLEVLPPVLEDKIRDGIKALDGAQVSIRRIVKGQISDDAQDIFLLQGKVPNQVALTRILSLAANIITGQSINVTDIRVVADEAGALGGIGGQGTGGGGAGGIGGGGFGGGGFGGGIGGGGGLGGGGIGGNLSNQIQRNIGRAKVLQAASGRILSFIEVSDIPQVRVDIRIYEVNRTKLRTYNSELATAIGQRIGVNASTIAPQLQTKQVGPGRAIQGLLGFLGGSLTGETQATAGRFALDSVLSYLEQQGIARTLSSPSLTVLSGEMAQFQVGGEIPVPEAFSPAFGGTANAQGSTPGVFNSVVFLNFGIQLGVRPLVGDDDTLTLDLLPMVTTPDTALTASIRQNTGTNPTTTAFQSRSLRTSARLQDGQVLLIGGLLSRNTNDQTTAPPGLRDVPGLGWLFRNFNKTDDNQELIVVVNPAIVRDPVPAVALWAYPGSDDLIREFGKKMPAPAAKPGAVSGKN